MEMVPKFNSDFLHIIKNKITNPLSFKMQKVDRFEKKKTLQPKTQLSNHVNGIKT